MTVATTGVRSSMAVGEVRGEAGGLILRHHSIPCLNVPEQPVQRLDRSRCSCSRFRNEICMHGTELHWRGNAQQTGNRESVVAVLGFQQAAVTADGAADLPMMRSDSQLLGRTQPPLLPHLVVHCED